MKRIEISDRTKLLIKTSIITGAFYALGNAIGNYAFKKVSKAMESYMQPVKDDDNAWEDWEKDLNGTDDVD